MTKSFWSSFDRFAVSRAASWAAFAWGFAESTVFFIVPDVLITFVAARRLRSGLRASFAALAGAVIGGTVMLVLGRVAPGLGRSILVHIPAIHDDLLATVHAQLDAHGPWALLIGPLRGIPYKIYAVDWGARGESVAAFLLVSLPARWLRFGAAALLSRAIANACAGLSKRRVEVEVPLGLALWVAFYVFYFTVMGL